MPFKTLTKNLIIESLSPKKTSPLSPKNTSSLSPKKTSSLSPKNTSPLSPKNLSSVPTQEDIDKYINNKLLNIKRNKNAIIMVGGPGSGKTSGIKIVLDITKKKLDDYVIVSPDDVLENFFYSDRTKYSEANKINNQLYKNVFFFKKNFKIKSYNYKIIIFKDNKKLILLKK